jgi:hypothetical protein
MCYVFQYRFNAKAVEEAVAAVNKERHSLGLKMINQLSRNAVVSIDTMI